jgi:energy-coupling factor transport system ATP-binding protein
LNALLRPTSGSCFIDGMDTGNEASLWAIRQTVGMVFQNPDNQIVAAIVEEDVAFGPENIGVPQAEIRPRVETALATVNMTEYAKHAPHLLSGGQKQRVAIAGVLALLPKCIVLDEPTAMLDPQGRGEIAATVKKLNKEKNITVIYITHKMEEALLADRIIVMQEGRMVTQGTPREVFGNVRQIKELGLEVPIAAEVAAELRASGQTIPKNIIKPEELAEGLCQ